MNDKSAFWKTLDRIVIAWTAISFTWLAVTTLPPIIVAVGTHFQGIPWPIAVPFVMATFAIAIGILRLLTEPKSVRMKLEIASPQAHGMLQQSESAPQDVASSDWDSWVEGCGASIKTHFGERARKSFVEAVKNASAAGRREVATRYLKSLALELESQHVLAVAAQRRVAEQEQTAMRGPEAKQDFQFDLSPMWVRLSHEIVDRQKAAKGALVWRFSACIYVAASQRVTIPSHTSELELHIWTANRSLSRLNARPDSIAISRDEPSHQVRWTPIVGQ